MNPIPARVTVVMILLAAANVLAQPATHSVRLETLDLAQMHQGYGLPQVNQSMRNKPLSIAGQTFAHGVGTHARSLLWINLAGGSERFTASVGADDAAGGPATITFRIYVDNKRVWDSGLMKLGDPAKPVDIKLTGATSMALLVGDGGDGITFDHADWADAQFLVSGADPVAAAPPSEPPVILTPKPPATPHINGPKIFGVRPGSPFLYRIPATGTRPMTFTADDLPQGLSLDANTGIITGQIARPGEFSVALHATNSLGTGKRDFKIVVGDQLALTPYMGWNHWYAWTHQVTDQTIREAADAMLANGMADQGYSYVNIDDCWAIKLDSTDPLRGGVARDAHGMIVPNKCFPDMKALTDYLHSKGFKAGIYSSPGPATCAKYEGSYQHEEQDAQQIAEWGFDFLKYDWCSYGRVAPHPDLAAAEKPYRQMSELLKKQPRDIVFNFCQYGMKNVWEWGREVGGHSWRTAGDLGAGTAGISGRMYSDVFEKYAKNNLHKFAGPGAWNDPDYLLLGNLITGQGKPVPFGLTPNEQYSHVSLWALVAAPLIYSGDVAHLDDFTLSLLCNNEVIEVDQDPLGQAAHRVANSEQGEVWMKEMQDGSKIVGLFNHDEVEATVTAHWSDLAIHGPHQVRDLWQQKDLGPSNDQFQATIPRHGVKLIRISAPSGG